MSNVAWVCITVVVLAVVAALTVGGINDQRQRSKQEAACVNSGGSWVRDFNGWECHK